jgi:23S rRNA (guanosine2251-2'-O)-methyltransferase
VAERPKRKRADKADAPDAATPDAAAPDAAARGNDERPRRRNRRDDPPAGDAAQPPETSDRPRRGRSSDADDSGPPKRSGFGFRDEGSARDRTPGPSRPPFRPGGSGPRRGRDDAPGDNRRPGGGGERGGDRPWRPAGDRGGERRFERRPYGGDRDRSGGPPSRRDGPPPRYGPNDRPGGPRREFRDDPGGARPSRPFRPEGDRGDRPFRGPSRPGEWRPSRPRDDERGGGRDRAPQRPWEADRSREGRDERDRGAGGGFARPFRDERPPRQDRGGFGRPERRPSGDERPPFGGDRRPPSGDRRPFSGDRPAYGGDRPAYRGDRPAYGGDRPAYGGDRPAYPTDRRPYDRPRPDRGEWRPRTAPAREWTPPAPDLLGEDEELIAGRRPVEEAFAARRDAKRLLVVPQRREALERIVLHATNLRIPVIEVEGGTLTAVAGFDGHQGVAVVVPPRRYATIDEVIARALERSEPPFVLALDSLEDPQNVGTLLRSAEAAGVHGVLFPTHRQAPLTPAAVKASAGAVEHLLLCPVDDLPGALADLHARGLRVAGAEAEAPLTARQSDLRGPLAIVVGSEGQGLGPAVRRRCDLLMRIPMHGAIDSLNAAVAGSVLLFEAVAQRDPTGTAPRRRTTTPRPAVTPPEPVAAAEPDADAAAEPGAARDELPDGEPQAAEVVASEPTESPESTVQADAAPAPDARKKAGRKPRKPAADAPQAADDDLLPGGPAAPPPPDGPSGDA